jgi:hypothetical protein
MYRLIAIEDFNIKDFDKLKNIARVEKEEKGKIFKGDTFECDEKMAKYLTNEVENPVKRSLAKVIEKLEKNTTKRKKKEE